LKGRLLFQESSIGIDAELLRNSKMYIRQRQAGERLRLAKNRPSRDLKSHFQSHRVPFWQRERLPYIYIDNKLFFVGLLGMDAAFLSESVFETELVKPKVQLIWLPDQPVNKA
jgi:tRNA(Ile)-lysidine synthase